MRKEDLTPPPTFIDLFAGCGGLSLGLMMAGWRGILAVERDRMAFATLRHNLVEGAHGCVFDWPDWFPKEACTVQAFAKKYATQLRQMRGQVTLVAGGPPCQGFSFAGRRNGDDRRNQLFKEYLTVVNLLKPPLALIENVRGINIELGKEKRVKKRKRRGRPPEPYAIRIRKALEKTGEYAVSQNLVRAVDFGVPQLRPRFFLIAIHKRIFNNCVPDPFHSLNSLREEFLTRKGLPVDRHITAREAISDLLATHGTTECVDSHGFSQGLLGQPSGAYQMLTKDGGESRVPDSHRFVKHRPDTVGRFRDLLDHGRRDVGLKAEELSRFGIGKQTLVVMDGDRPAHTLTTLPDDMIHYLEPRVLTVREYARLQSIPDWFQFKGKYTTGGILRKKECPRYTQAGNAVPPLLAEAWGLALKDLIRGIDSARQPSQLPTEVINVETLRCHTNRMVSR